MMGKNLNNFQYLEISDLENIYGGGIASSIGYGIGYVAGAFISFLYGYHSDGKDTAKERCNCN